MIKATEIPMPKEWERLSAQGTRFELCAHLYEIMNWQEAIQFSRYRTQFSDYCFFFLDDFEFSENPESMVGQSLFEDELPHIRRFIEAFEPFADSVPDELSFGAIDKSKIVPPPAVIKLAKELYGKLLEKGNPKVERYLK